ncbi:MAG: bifunctional 4-hydroxy-2-oxoglutarate aldolase/2-dehydro-3-deoxy-phosphogluconate aldolase [Deltaproteobacteria bacterium]|nr:bifunctional 4-hydroxy-2-oxoglutarate aldolase/2-dehydro-3-deoxy-phosphogluconate aldolase [Deltaproteobacteria bacterium]
MKIDAFKAQPFIGILRGIKAEDLAQVLDASMAAGLAHLEITLNTDDALALIRQARGHVGDDLSIGAGTVLTVDTMKQALDAGAQFIVMPTLQREIVQSCVDQGIPVFPGAFTPQEIQVAWEAGASMVKVFPAKSLGPEYFKEIKGPFEQIELLACGGITPDSVPRYRSCGASGFAFGGSVFRTEWIEQGRFQEITASLQALLRA